MPLPLIILPGYFAAAVDYLEMEKALIAGGFEATIVPLARKDWFPTLGGRSITPILNRIHATVEQVRESTGSDRVNLVAHSAGGWIARIYLGSIPYDIHGQVPGQTYAWGASCWVDRLVTLGSPHVSQERWTKKNLNFVNDRYPGAFEPDVRYVCVAGRAVYGRKGFGGKKGQWLAHSSYELTGGTGETWGDGITPIAAAHLENAENITLDSVWHSPRSPGLWYGTPDVIAQWSDFLR
jgi:pimeloyl-ACP methyl ester carboxylesterase